MTTLDIKGQQRTIIEAVTPEIDGARFPIKRVVGEEVVVEADIFADGHEVIAAVLKSRTANEEQWSETPMEHIVNDRWRGSFTVSALGCYCYTIEAWVDRFQTWRRDLEKKFHAGQDVSAELVMGAELIAAVISQASQHAAAELKSAARTLSPETEVPLSAKISIALSPKISELMQVYASRSHATTYSKDLRVIVDPVLARFGSWYELFPRSCAPEPGKHGTFKDCEALLPTISEMGFDVLYLAPIHPVGGTFRKGKNNSRAASPGEPGSPWGIGSEEGGHKAIHRELGTLEDFRSLVNRAREAGIHIALDIAFQCSPDHPWVRDHPEWFRKRPDGTIQHAENPPKKYEDIYPLNFETEDWEGLWQELKSVFEFWIEQGVRIFRVDNPHTKSFRFWAWCISDLKTRYPDLILLSEAFTRPKVMYYLAKLGFTQSYNYFPWRNNKWELTQYFTELAASGVRQYFRPNLWTNTPDILTHYLQYGGRPAFMIRLILAATLGASYGIYGPPFELCENAAREPGSEEYLNSEKYEIRHWDRKAPGNLSGLIARVNQIRRQNSALQSDDFLRFHETDNGTLLCYSKQSASGDNIIVVVLNLDPHYLQRGWVMLDLPNWGIHPRDTYQLHDLLTDARYFWHGPRNYVELNPHRMPAHIFSLKRYVRTEHDFDYFM
jgi:starch synthase (maltosyl-transferring)